MLAAAAVSLTSSNALGLGLANHDVSEDHVPVLSDGFLRARESVCLFKRTYVHIYPIIINNNWQLWRITDCELQVISDYYS